MEWFTFLVFPAFTLGGIALGLTLHSIKKIKNMERRVEELENKNK
ncbi:hypothetical protein [Bacillus cereus]|nr:hypothetical protein [Bacillus cereus]